MGMEKYKNARWRFTWKGRSKRRGNGRVPVLRPCKDQRGDEGEGKCVKYSLSMVLEALINLSFDIDVVVPTDTLETDLKNFKGGEHQDNAVWHACEFLDETGALAVKSEDGAEVRYKLHSFHPITMTDKKDLTWALEIYMQNGPMVGVFAIHGNDMESYEETEVDEIYFVSKHIPLKAYHSVALPGFGVTSIYPFWHFQNSYSSSWRGPARGFGQLYAPHLQEIYGLRVC